MSTYKVIQDIEAEDKLLGPLTLKQFIFAAITITCGYLSFLALTKGAAFLLFFLLPPMILFGFLAFPWGREQPTEIWLVAKLRFLVKPRKRIWDQSGMKQLVTITAPVVEEKTYTNGLSEGEVRSRLQALANTIDSRGWAIKNVNVNLFSQPQYALEMASDRLIDPATLPQEVVNYDVMPSDDILDERNNRTAHNLDQMINATTAAHRQQLLEQMRTGGPTQATATNQSAGQPADYWFLNQPTGGAPAGQAMFNNSSPVQPGATPTTTSNTPLSDDEQELLTNLHKNHKKGSAAYSHMKTITPLGEKKNHTHAKSAKKANHTPAKAPADQSSETSRSAPNPAILELAKNDDLNVATIARQANKQTSGDDEVVISLH